MTDDSTDPELDILDLALRLRWEDVAAKANEAPEDIASIDQDGLNGTFNSNSFIHSIVERKGGCAR